MTRSKNALPPAVRTISSAFEKWPPESSSDVSVRIRDKSESTSSSEAATLSPWMMPSNASTPARVTCEEALIA